MGRGHYWITAKNSVKIKPHFNGSKIFSKHNTKQIQIYTIPNSDKVHPSASPNAFRTKCFIRGGIIG